MMLNSMVYLNVELAILISEIPLSKEISVLWIIWLDTSWDPCYPIKGHLYNWQAASSQELMHNVMSMEAITRVRLN